MTFNVLNLGSVLHSGRLHMISVNAIRIEIDGVKYNLPEIVPNKIEFDYAQSSGINLNSSIFEYIYKPKTIASLQHPASVIAITNNYRKYLTKYGPIGDFYLQLAKDNQLPNALRRTLHQIQFNAGARIISDCEPDREQSVAAFAQQITSTQSHYPKNIVTPTIDIETQLSGRFNDKLQWAMDNGFKRINVIYRAIKPNISNWIDLSRTIRKQNVWINVVGVLPRYHMTTMVSTISTAFMLGVHTVSLGYAWRGTPNANSYLLNSLTHRFNLARPNVTYPQSRSNSIISMSNDLITARQHILGNTYFSDYVAQRQGLRQMLNSIT